jgi:hypothetical protein
MVWAEAAIEGQNAAKAADANAILFFADVMKLSILCDA